jgi:hypothetical protein
MVADLADSESPFLGASRSAMRRPGMASVRSVTTESMDEFTVLALVRKICAGLLQLADVGMRSNVLS